MPQRNRISVAASVIGALYFGSQRVITAARAQETITIDAHAQATPFPHFWEQMFGSGHAILALRESYRDDLRAVKKVTDFRYVRFHGILMMKSACTTEDEHGNPSTTSPMWIRFTMGC